MSADTAELIGAASIAFCTTSTDDFALLLALLADRHVRARDVLLARLLATATIVAIAAVLALGIVAQIALPAYLPGIVLLVIGLLKFRHSRAHDDHDTHTPGPVRQNLFGLWLACTSGGFDNALAYLSIFAARPKSDMLLSAGTLMLLSAGTALATFAITRRIGMAWRGKLRLAQVAPYATVLLAIHNIAICIH
ncbi:hypothetical protein EHZ19_29905 [Paraburkholderia bannensis]|nr:hypothetical protein [Paraburkholderia bannensis]RQM44187.1 hypothetical protein EHZ19_29905 [Paraburkholderia bannensis]